MKTEEENFENSWQKQFKEAAIQPPDHVWENIERELERKKSRPFWLMYAPPQYLACGIAAALLLVWAGINYFQEKPLQSSPSKILSSTQKTQVLRPNSTEIAITFNKNSHSKNTFSSTNLAKKAINSLMSKSTVTANLAVVDKTFQTLASDNPIPRTMGVNSREEVYQNNDNQVINIQNANTSNLVNQPKIEALQTRGYYVYRNRFTMDRNKLVADFSENESNKNSTDKSSRLYVGLQSGAVPFNPNIQLGSVSTTAYAMAKQNMQNNGTNAFIDPNTGMPLISQIPTAQNAIKSGVSGSLAFHLGYQLDAHWSIESGLRYWEGNSTLSSNSYTYNTMTGEKSTYLVDYLLSLSSNATVASTSVALQQNTTISNATNLNNRYDYLSIPMQAAYTILPKHRLNFSILGGLAADIFLRNVISDQNNTLVKTTLNNESNIYKPLNISALAGIRGNYLLDKRWQLNLGTSYQKALSSGFQNSNKLQMNMQLWGIQAGINYHF